MITLHIAQLLEDAGFGGLNTSIFWEDLPKNKNGIAIISLGSPLVFKGRNESMFELISRGENDLMGNYKLEKINDYLLENLYKCSLPAVKNISNIKYRNIIFNPISSIENWSFDANGRMLWRCVWSISYLKERNSNG